MIVTLKVTGLSPKQHKALTAVVVRSKVHRWSDELIEAWGLRVKAGVNYSQRQAVINAWNRELSSPVVIGVDPGGPSVTAISRFGVGVLRPERHIYFSTPTP